MQALADRLFGHFEKGEYAAAGALFAPEARLCVRYGPAARQDGIGYPEFAAQASTGPLARLGRPEYLDRRVVPTSDGFIEQHTTRLTVAGQAVEMPCLIAVRCLPSGLIAMLEEYLDPSPIQRLLGRDLPQPALGQPELPDGAVVLVTGASSGIGAQVAIQYAAKRCRVVLAGRRESELQKVAAACRAAHPHSQLLVVPTDVADQRQCERLVAVTQAEFGEEIHRLVLNAGMSQNCHLSQSAPGLVQRMMQVNFMGAAAVAQAALPSLVPGQSRIVVVSSALGLMVAATQTGYCASKWALHGFFGALRCELQPKEISVSIVCPGPVNTGILGNLEGPDGSRCA